MRSRSRTLLLLTCLVLGSAAMLFPFWWMAPTSLSTEAQATEAAITNALLAAETTTGANDLRVFAMPVDRMLAAMRKYGRLP